MVTAVLCKWYPFFHLSLICCSGLVSLFPCQLHACKAFRALSPCSEICTPSRWKTGERMVSWLLLPQETWICFCVTLEKSHSARLYLVTQCPAEIQSYCWALWLWNVAFPSCLLHLSLCCSTVPSDRALSLHSSAARNCTFVLVPYLSKYREQQHFRVAYHGCLHAWPGAIKCKYLTENKLSSKTNEWTNKQTNKQE